MFIAPITSKVPEADRQAILIPETEARRAKLETHLALWVMVDELNADVFETSYTLEDRSPRGAFSPAFTDALVRGVQEVREAGKLQLAKRQ